ncbi:hypothetical protein Cadr_000023388 [Camelus dromedarius]|uniref:Uncharacterized protein n=1 Tax=Camelus dromedarius TaxID=9838 RepID=A0A5N4CJ23_CAMDR|nr:hypothetical protein Cadr_000023388 [Camelus dromedarius]
MVWKADIGVESLLSWRIVERLSENIWKMLGTIKGLSTRHGASMFFEQVGCFRVFVDFWVYQLSTCRWSRRSNCGDQKYHLKDERLD